MESNTKAYFILDPTSLYRILRLGAVRGAWVVVTISIGEIKNSAYFQNRKLAKNVSVINDKFILC